MCVHACVRACVSQCVVCVCACVQHCACVSVCVHVNMTLAYFADVLVSHIYPVTVGTDMLSVEDYKYGVEQLFIDLLEASHFSVSPEVSFLL